jgi:hypothetical protein
MSSNGYYGYCITGTARRLTGTYASSAKPRVMKRIMIMKKHVDTTPSPDILRLKEKYPTYFNRRGSRPYSPDRGTIVAHVGYDKFMLREFNHVVGRYAPTGRPLPSSMNIFSYSLYRNLVKAINARLCVLLTERGRIHLPLGIGELVIEKWQPAVYKAASDGPYYSNKVRVDWQATMKLRASDPEAITNKIFIKYPPGEIARVRYLHNLGPNGRFLKLWTGHPLRKMMTGLCRKHSRDGKLDLPAYYQNVVQRRNKVKP